MSNHCLPLRTNSAQTTSSGATLAMANRKGFIQGYIAGASRPVTDAEIEKARVAYVEAWEAERKRIGRGIAPKGTKSRAGMRAALEAIRPTEGNPT
mgnify:FL=1